MQRATTPLPNHAVRLPAAKPISNARCLARTPRTTMSWLQVRLAITPAQAPQWEDQLLDMGAVSVTYIDGEDQPIYEPDLGTTPLWSNTHLLALFASEDHEQAQLEQQLAPACQADA